MPKHRKLQYNKKSTQQAAAFADTLVSAATSSSTAIFDSAAAETFIGEQVSRSGSALPEELQKVLDEAGENSGVIVRAIYDGIQNYEAATGEAVPADVIESSIHAAYSTTMEARKLFDSANSDHADNLSLQPNRAVVAILNMFAEPIPFAHYLPADIGSNEARLAILSHTAGSTFGGYAQGDLMDGVAGGNAFITSARIHKCAISDADGTVTGKLTKIQLSDETCDPAAGDLKLMRGRSVVYVNGFIAAREVSQAGSGGSAISGSITLGETNYAIAGSINTDTGAIALTTNPKLPTTNQVVVEGFIDYERDDSLIPRIITSADTFSLYAKPWHAYTQIGIDARTQIGNELGLDAFSEGVLAIQNQFGNERHYEAIHKLARIAANNQEDFEYNWSGRSLQMNRSQIWNDFGAVVGKVSLKMAIATMAFGVKYFYVGKELSAQFRALPREMFEPSGLPERAGIYRIGRFLGIYDVYFTPKGVYESADGTSAQVLCIGQSADVTRSPIVLGDAVAPTVQALGMSQNLKQGSGFYARNFTSVNPHAPSAQGAAFINVSGLK
ncbi:hypothetical protein [Uliginosibacterium sediminicola]|uniref:Uncharacterized protein n=1 Tax=Uliginosibacterium sediminicola TaxID=2024550 RepID=A0ABU9YW21_9RHOO